MGVLWESKPGSDCVVVLCAVLARYFVLLQLRLLALWSSSGAFIVSCFRLVCFLCPAPGAGGPWQSGDVAFCCRSSVGLWVVVLWEPATVARYFVALLLVSSGVFVSSAVIQCSVKP